MSSNNESNPFSVAPPVSSRSQSPPSSRKRATTNPFDEDFADNDLDTSNHHYESKPGGEARRFASPSKEKVPVSEKRPVSARKSSLLSGQDPVDVSTLSEEEKKVIMMGVSVEAAREASQKESGDNVLKSLVASAKSVGGKRSGVWSPAFTLKVTGHEVNTSTGKKPFTEYIISGDVDE